MADLVLATLGLSVWGRQGKEAALLLQMGVLGVTAGSISPPGSAVILQARDNFQVVTLQHVMMSCNTVISLRTG